MNKHWIRTNGWPIAFTCLLAAVTPAIAQELRVEAFVAPDTIMAGETAQYTIRFQNAQSLPNMIAPKVDGLLFSSQSATSQRVEIINGRRSQSTDLSWNLQAQREGSFTIPGRQVRIGQQDLLIPAATVRVIPKSEEARSRALLVLDVEDRPFFVGEAIPATLHLLVRSDLNLAGVDFPRTTETSFTHHGLNTNPQRGSTRYNGMSYVAFTWEFVITPIRAGTVQLDFSQQITLQFADPSSARSSFFGFGRTRTENYVLENDPRQLRVQPLPSADRPESFHDAIGQFDVELRWSSRQLQVGEPITLQLILTGQGNFDRIAAPKLPEWENWRVYPPRTTFSPQDDRPHRGQKLFEYILIPQTESIEHLPGFNYSTFDPVSRQFLSNDFSPEPVTVKPASANDGRTVAFGRRTEDNASVPSSLLPLRPSPGTLKTPALALHQQPLYWIGNGLIGSLLLAAFFVEKRKARHRNDLSFSRRAASNRKILALLRSAEQAASRSDATLFYQSGRTAVQEIIAQHSAKPVDPSTLVISDCEQILASSGVRHELYNDAIQLLQTADNIQFSGTSATRRSLQPEIQRLKALIANLQAVNPN